MRYLILIVVLLLVLCSGCTMRFRAENCELDTMVKDDYKFDRLGFVWEGAPDGTVLVSNEGFPLRDVANLNKGAK